MPSWIAKVSGPAGDIRRRLARDHTARCRVLSRARADKPERSLRPCIAWCSRPRHPPMPPAGPLMALLERTDLLAPIRDKVEAGDRLDFEDGVALMESDDILALGELADLARRVRGGDDRVYFVQNLYLNQTNVCRVKCKFCAFAVTNKQADAYTYTPDELVEDAVRQHELTGFSEIHMVGGESPHVGFGYYVEIVRQLHTALPDVHLKLFTASEIHHMTKLSGLTHEEVLH